MSVNLPFVIIDDEELTLSTYERIIRKICPDSSIRIFLDGLEAWDYLKTFKGKIIILSGVNIQTIGGFQLLKNVRNASNIEYAYFIMTTNSVEPEINFKSLQVGADDFIKKPLSTDDIIGKVKTSIRVMTLYNTIEQKDEKIFETGKEISEYTANSIKLLKEIQKRRIPDVEKILARIKDKAVWVAKEYGGIAESDIRNISQASELCYLGRIFLHDKNVKDILTINGNLKNEAYLDVPVSVVEMMSRIPNTEQLSGILGSIYENIDGSGHPKKLKSWQIPIGARILRVLIDYEELATNKNWDFNKIYPILEAEENRIYDFKTVILIDQYEGYQSLNKKYGKEMQVKNANLKKGMTLSRSLFLESGYKLLAAGTTMNEDQVEKIQMITVGDPLIGQIYCRDY